MVNRRRTASEISRTLRPAGVAQQALSPSVLPNLVRFQRLIERGVAFRCRTLSLPYGDQGLFLRRSLFTMLGGFPEWPILEDVEFAACGSLADGHHIGTCLHLLPPLAAARRPAHVPPPSAYPHRPRAWRFAAAGRVAVAGAVGVLVV